MRPFSLSFFTLCALLCLSQAQAQTVPASTSVPASSLADEALTIAPPPGGTVQVDMDVRDDDLLGVFKSLLKGVSEGGQAVAANQAPLMASTRSGSYADMGRQVAGIVSRADLGDILKDVTHVRFVLYTLPGGTPSISVVTPYGKPKASAATSPTPPTPDLTAQYETAFAAEGGHRILFINSDPVHVVMTSFGHAHGSALVVQAPGSLAILRANGYPDLSKLSALATQIGTVAAQVATEGKGTPSK